MSSLSSITELKFRISDEAARSLSGLILKNNIRLQWTQMPSDVQTMIREETLAAIGDRSPLIRATVGIIITTVVCKEGIRNWPQLLPTLCEAMESTNQFECEVKILELFLVFFYCKTDFLLFFRVHLER